MPFMLGDYNKFMLKWFSSITYIVTYKVWIWNWKKDNPLLKKIITLICTRFFRQRCCKNQAVFWKYYKNLKILNMHFRHQIKVDNDNNLGCIFSRISVKIEIEIIRYPFSELASYYIKIELYLLKYYLTSLPL